MGPNFAVSVNWAKGHSDVLNSFSASTCRKPCEWTETLGLKPALFIPWKNPILSFAPPTRCESPLPECAGKTGPWVTDKTYASHHTRLHKTKAPLRVKFNLIQSLTVLIHYFLKGLPCSRMQRKDYYVAAPHSEPAQLCIASTSL